VPRHRVGSVADFSDESLTALEVGGQELVLIRHQGAWYAVPDRCTHARYPLHDGSLDDGSIVCCHHGARFDLQTGRPTSRCRRSSRVARYAVTVDGDDVLVDLPADAPSDAWLRGPTAGQHRHRGLHVVRCQPLAGLERDPDALAGSPSCRRARSGWRRGAGRASARRARPPLPR
jgi:3-phenylpropionate/trans-cinnamate dioxygenase ferredoxin component